MITEYIGSLDDFLNCYRVAFCDVKPNISLVRSELNTYTPDNSYVFKYEPKLVNKELVRGFDEPVFRCRFTKQDKQMGYIVNYLVMYDYLNKPIGFVDLQQNIDIFNYDVDTITLEFNYQEDVQAVQLVLDATYAPHILATKNNQAHRILFSDLLRSRKASTKDAIASLVPTRKKSTRNLLNIYRNPKLLYRYSGTLALGYQYLKETQYVIPDSIFFNAWEQPVGTISGILNVDGVEYIAIWYRTGSKLVRAYDSKVFELDFQIITPYHIANNFVLETTYTKDSNGKVTKHQYIHPTKVLVTESIDNTRTSPAQMSKTSNFDGEDLDLDDTYHICKDPFKTELLIYRRYMDSIIYLSDGLDKIMYDFGNPNIGDKEILFASKGFLALGNFSGECLEVSKVEFYNFNLHGEIIDGKWTQKYNLDDGSISYYTNEENTGLFDSMELELIVPITPDLIMYQSRGNIYLTEFRVNKELDDYSVSPKTDVFLGHSKYKNIRLVAKEYDADYIKKNYSLCFFSLHGNLYKYKSDGDSITVNRL